MISDNCSGECAGIKEDGSIMVWSDMKSKIITKFLDLQEICMVFYCCIGIDGEKSLFFFIVKNDKKEIEVTSD